MIQEAYIAATSISFIFIILGLWGNPNIVYAVYRKKSLQTKCGFIIGLIAAIETIFLYFEFFHAVQIVSEWAMLKSKCLKMILFYVVITTTQNFIICRLGCE